MGKKLYTESNPRLDTQPISEYKLGEEEGEPSTHIYLVEVLSRFLHGLKLNLLPEVNERLISKLEF